MTNPCINGSEKKQDAPESFTVDTGAICFLLGLDSPICGLLDKIPSLVGKPWKEIIGAVAGAGLGIVIDQITGQIDTEQFCSLGVPPSPSEITYSDVFDFIASYVPPFSLVASGDGLLRKITGYYLVSKYFDYCQCKEKDGSQPPPAEIPPVTLQCGTAFQQIVDEAIDFYNQRNATTGNPFGHFFYVQGSSTGQTITEQAYQAALSAYQNAPNTELVSSIPTDNEAQYVTTTNIAGCLKVILNEKPDATYTWTDTYRNTENNSLFIPIEHGYSIRFPTNVTFDENACCPPTEPPEPPIVPPPPTNCPPIPPPRFCELFPDDPSCANVPEPEGVACEATDIDVADYDCVSGLYTKTVTYKL